MIKSIRYYKGTWTQIIEDEYNRPIYATDKRITALVSRKIEYLAKICSARISHIIEQLNDEKRKKIKMALEKYKVKT